METPDKMGIAGAGPKELREEKVDIIGVPL